PVISRRAATRPGRRLGGLVNPYVVGDGAAAYRDRRGPPVGGIGPQRARQHVVQAGRDLAVVGDDPEVPGLDRGHVARVSGQVLALPGVVADEVGRSELIRL